MRHFVCRKRYLGNSIFQEVVSLDSNLRKPTDIISYTLRYNYLKYFEQPWRFLNYYKPRTLHPHEYLIVQAIFHKRGSNISIQ